MNYFDWDKEKNEILIKERGISFEEIKVAVDEDIILNDYDHPNQKRYPGQKIMVVKVNNYAYLVPYVKEGERIFLKTIIPSRKATKKYLERRKL
ncbi:MAG: BrnT family toxin [Candidatus Levybacteria bacterium]|nr:BrnT family toxin [Candidatus Levybacteria bacterium]